MLKTVVNLTLSRTMVIEYIVKGANWIGVVSSDDEHFGLKEKAASKENLVETRTAIAHGCR